MRKSKPLTVTLRNQQCNIDRRVDRDEAAMDEMMRQKIFASLADPRADIPGDDVFARLRAHHEDQLKGRR